MRMYRDVKKRKIIPLAYRKLKEISPNSHFLKLEMGGYWLIRAWEE